MADLNLIRIDDLPTLTTIPSDLTIPGAADSDGNTGKVFLNDLKANILTAPVVTGVAQVPTANAGDNSTKPASTAYVQTELTNKGLNYATTTTLGTVRMATGNDPVPTVYSTTDISNLLGGFSGPSGVSYGGTGSTTASGARANLGAAKNGANSDITALTGLTGIPALIAAFMDYGSPVGQICAFAGVPPASTENIDFKSYMARIGWLECDGAEYTGGAQPALLDIVRTNYGSGSGTFKVPDLRGRTVLGAGTSAASGTVRPIANTGGADTHTLAVGELPAHAHSIVTQARTASVTGNGTGLETGDPSAGLGAVSTGNNGSGTAHNNLPPFIALKNYIRAEPFSVVYARMLPLYGKIPTFAEYRTNPL
jgi:microcystin-dependent protein